GGSRGVWLIITPVILLGVAVLFRVFDAKFWGVVAMGGAVVILFFLPWLDHSPVKSIRYRPTWHKYLYGIFIVNFLMLGYLGTQPPNPTFNLMSQIGTVIYLAFFVAYIDVACCVAPRQPISADMAIAPPYSLMISF